MTDADRQALWPILALSFGMDDPQRWDRWAERLGRDNLRIAKVDGVVAGGLGFYRCAQVFGGKAVPMGGIAGVGVAPEHRTRGIARQLVEDTLRDLRRDGVPLAGLYPATWTVYRKSGFELAGHRCERRVSAKTIGVRAKTPDVRPAPRAHIESLYRPHHGGLVRDAALWSRLFDGYDSPGRGYVIGDDEGWVILARSGGPGHFDLIVRDFQVFTPGALRRFWSFMADHRSMAVDVVWTGPAVDWRAHVLPESQVRVTDSIAWMLRVLDVPAALLARGYATDGELHLEVVGDPLFEANNARWVLRVQDGRPSVEPGGRGDLSVDIAGLAPLYSGYCTAGQLTVVGQVRGSDIALQAADRLFGGQVPWLPEIY